MKEERSGMKFKFIFTLACIVAGSLIGLASRRAAVKEPEWPATPTERIAFTGIQTRRADLEQEIARVASGSPALMGKIAEIANAAIMIAIDDQSFGRDLRAARGIPEGTAIVLSGTSWVPAPKPPETPSKRTHP